MDCDHTYVFVASAEIDGRTKWLRLYVDDWVLESHLGKATTYLAASDLRTDLEEYEVIEYEIHPVKVKVME